MCRMIAAPLGIPGRDMITPFLRMAQGRNLLSELNKQHGQLTHADGWGAVYEKNGQISIFRSTQPCWEDPAVDRLADARVFLLHARKASQGAVSLDNTHPFEHAMKDARWFYCHNGTVRDPLPSPPTLRRVASTDSERMFHLLLPYVLDDRVVDGVCSVFGGLRDFTCLNSFLLGSAAFWAVSRFTENPNYYTLSFVDTPRGPVFSSETLCEFGSNWASIPNGSAVYVDRTTGGLTLHSLD